MVHIIALSHKITIENSEEKPSINSPPHQKHTQPNPKFEAPIPLPLHTTPPPQKGPKRLTQGPSSPP